MNETKIKVVYSHAEAAELLSMSRTSLWRERKRRKIYPLKTLGGYAREELERYAREETQLSKRTKRFPSIKTNQITQETHATIH